jgi:hypothetical protein
VTADLPALATPSTTYSVVSSLVGRVEPFRPGPRLTTLADWFTTPDQQTLILAVRPGATVDEASTAVAHALAWQHDRKLILLLPPAAVDPVTARLAYVGTRMSIWSIREDLSPTEAPIPTVDNVVAAARQRPLRGEPQHDLGPSADWVADLTAAADGHWALDAAHRGSYLAWHCAGRQVLKLTRTGGGVLIQAGVQYRTPPPDRQPVAYTAIAPLTAAQRAQAEAAIAVAVADRLIGRDNTHLEHQLQAALDRPGLRQLGMRALAREYPAWRADGAPGYIDFLGLDADGHLHVIETKIGPDDMLVFQALDYVTWVTAHADAIRAELGWPAGDNAVVHIDFLVAPKTGDRPAPALGPYTAGQLAALRDDVPWRIHLIDDPRSDIPVIRSQPAGHMPPPRPRIVATPVG